MNGWTWVRNLEGCSLEHFLKYFNPLPHGRKRFYSVLQERMLDIHLTLKIIVCPYFNTLYLCPWKFSDKNIGVGCLLQGPGVNPSLLHQTCNGHLGSPIESVSLLYLSLGRFLLWCFSSDKLIIYICLPVSPAWGSVVYPWTSLL